MAADDVTTPSGGPTSTTGRHRRWLTVGGIVAALVIVGGVWAVVANRDDGASTSFDAAQIGRMHQGCQEWADSHRGPGGPDDAWCRSMADWMDSRMDGRTPGQGGMTGGPMMWQDPAAMRTTCEQWTATDADAVPEGTDAGEWCGQMVDWMDRHMGDWDDWMMDGPRRGGA